MKPLALWMFSGLAACGAATQTASPASSTSLGQGDTAENGFNPTADPPDGLPLHDSGGDGNVPQWLAWAGEDILTVDVFADGVVDCVFVWDTSGIHASERCEDCDFTFLVRRSPNLDRSTCAGATDGSDTRWIREERFYVDDLGFDESHLVGETFFARHYRLEVDPVYGAPVAQSLEVAAALR